MLASSKLEGDLRELLQHIGAMEAGRKISFQDYYTVASEMMAAELRKRLRPLEMKMLRIEMAIKDLEGKREPPVVIPDTVVTQLASKITSLVGLREAATSKNRIVKNVWWLLFLTGVVTTIYVTTATISEYLDEPTATKVKLNVSAEYDLPTIAFCPAAWMDTEKALAMGISLEGFKYSLGYVDVYSGMRLSNATQAKLDFLSFYESKNFKSLLDYYKAVSLDLDIVHSSEAFKKSSMALKVTDTDAETVKKVFVGFEMCYAYAPKTTGRNLYTKATATAKFFDKTQGVGTILSGMWFQLVTDTDFMNTLSAPIYLPAYTRNKILIRAERYTMMDKEDAPCLENADSPDAYHSFPCAVECRNKMYQEAINCQTFRHSRVSTAGGPMDYCHTMEPLPFKNVTLISFKSSTEHENMTQFCMEQCPAGCDRVIYEAVLQWQTDDIDHMDIAREHKQTVIHVTIDHNANYVGGMMNFKEVNTYTFIALLNNVGGTLGLFVGATSMTLVQLIAFCIEHTIRTVKKEKSEK